MVKKTTTKKPTEDYTSFGEGEAYYDKEQDRWMAEMRLSDRGREIIDSIIVKSNTEPIGDLGLKRYLVKNGVLGEISKNIDSQYHEPLHSFFETKFIDSGSNVKQFQFMDIFQARQFVSGALKQFFVALLQTKISEKKRLVCEILVKEKDYKYMPIEKEDVISVETGKKKK